MKIGIVDRILFALLRMALNDTVDDDINWKHISEEEWENCYRLSVEQGVMAIAWDGLQYVINKCKLSRSLKITWAISVENYEQKYEYHCQTVTELSKLYREYGIGMVLLKGVGFSSYYPIPSHREGGDIDIYTYSMNHQIRNDQEANFLADELMVKRGVSVDTRSYKHSNFYYRGISIENHKTFLSVQFNSIAKPMNKLLHKLLKPISIDLYDGKYQILVPPPTFNALFLSFHAAQHFGYGFRLHHLVDWACLLKRVGWCMPKEVNDKRFLIFVKAMTHLCNNLLGTSIAVKGGEHFIDILYKQMMHSPYNETILVKGRLNIFWYKLKRMLYGHKMNCMVFDISLLKIIVYSIWFHVQSYNKNSRK